MLSKELLSEVLGTEVENFNYIPNDKQTLSSNEGFIVATEDAVPIINIYELAHKCKEWARNNGYWIQSGLRGTGGGYADFGRYHETDNKMIDSLNYTATEYEAIFKACQWVKDKINPNYGRC